MNAPLRWAWIILLTAATLMRIGGLAQTPLTPDESATALASLDIAQGRSAAPTGEGALLVVGNALLFALSGAGDGIARLLPALAGAALAAVPWLWRRRLGEVGALVAAGILGFSPLLLFASRSVSGTTVGLLGAVLLLTALFAGIGGRDDEDDEFSSDEDEDEDESPQSSWLVVAGLALGLTGGAVFYDLMLAGFCAWFIYGRIRLKRLRWPFAMRDLLVGAAIAVLVSVGFGFHMDWSGIGSGFAGWFNSWRTWGGGAGLLLLAVYEPLTLLLALTGLGWGIARGNRRALVIGAVAIPALVLALLHPGASTMLWTTFILPCAFLGGFGVQRVVEELPQSTRFWILLHIALEFLLWVPAGLALAAYAHNSNMAKQPGWLILLGAIVLLALHFLTAILFTFVMPATFVWRSTLLGLAVALLTAQYSAGWRLSLSASPTPAEPAAMVRTSPDVWNLRRTLDGLSIARGLRRDSVSLTLVASDPAKMATLRWTLRDFPKTKIVAEWSAADNVFVIAPEWVRPSPDSGAWRGMRFVAINRSTGRVPGCQSLYPLVCVEWVGWYMYREAPADMVLSESMMLWERP